MSDGPSESATFLLNYAEVVRRCAAMERAKQMESAKCALGPSKGAEVRNAGVPPSPPQHAGDTARMTLSPLATPPPSQRLGEPLPPSSSILTSPKVVNAKPYVPTYLAALKAQSFPVLLDGVPVNVNKPQRQTTTEWCSSTNVSNSLLENDTGSSWADDDACFLESIGCIAGVRSKSGTRVATEVSVETPSALIQGRKGSPDGGEMQGGNADPRARGWRQAGGGRNGVNFRESSRPQQRQRSEERRSGRRNSNHSGNPSRGGGGGGGWAAKKQNGTVGISGGRFDGLARPKMA